MTETADFAQPLSLVTWASDWRELDLITGLAIDASGNQELLDPTDFGTTPRDGIQFADVTVQGSPGPNRVFAGVNSTVIALEGSDELFNTDSLGGNILVGGPGFDRLFLKPIHDLAIGGELLTDSDQYSLPNVVGLADEDRDIFLIDSANSDSNGPLHILDFEVGTDQLLIDGTEPVGSWSSIKSQLASLNVNINATPKLSEEPIQISLQPGVTLRENLSAFASDLDGDELRLLILQGPSWLSASGGTLTATAPANSTAEDLESTELVLGFTDGKAVIKAPASIKFVPPPPTPILPQLSISPANADLLEGNSGRTPFTFTISRSGDLTGTSSASWRVTRFGNRSANPADFTGTTFPTGVVSFAAGETSKTITVNVKGDTGIEKDENFQVLIEGAQKATVDPSASSAAGIIRNDDSRPARPPSPNQPDGTPRPGTKLRGSKGVDELVGSEGKDIFAFKGVQSPSRKGKLRYDTIINFEQRDSLRLNKFREVVLGKPDSRQIRNLQGTADKFTFKSIDKVLGDGFRKKSIAALEVGGFDGTFLAVSGGRPGFDRRDLLIFLEGYSLLQDGPIQLV